MKYQIAVYFDGPRSRFGGRLHADECIFIGESPWLWLARASAKSNLGNTGRCSYVISHADKVLEEFKALPKEEPDTEVDERESNIIDADRPGGRV